MSSAGPRPDRGGELLVSRLSTDPEGVTHCRPGPPMTDCPGYRLDLELIRPATQGDHGRQFNLGVVGLVLWFGHSINLR